MQSELRKQLLRHLAHAEHPSPPPRTLQQHAFNSLVAEYLAAAQLTCTLSVFLPEAALDGAVPLRHHDILTALRVRQGSLLWRRAEAGAAAGAPSARRRAAKLATFCVIATCRQRWHWLVNGHGRAYRQTSMERGVVRAGEPADPHAPQCLATALVAAAAASSQAASQDAATMTAAAHDSQHVSARLAALDQRYLDGHGDCGGGGGQLALALAGGGGGGVAAAVAAARRECEARADLHLQTQVRRSPAAMCLAIALLGHDTGCKWRRGGRAGGAHPRGGSRAGEARRGGALAARAAAGARRAGAPLRRARGAAAGAGGGAGGAGRRGAPRGGRRRRGGGAAP